MSQFILFPAVGGGGDGDGVEIGDLETEGAVTVYVDAAGNDANPGTSGAPFATIQKALDVLPKRVIHGVRINVGVGTFAGGNIVGFHFSPGGYIAIVGTMSAVALT